MKTKAISSFFVLFALVAGLSATMPDAFADHSEVTIEPVAGSWDVMPDCMNEEYGCFSPGQAIVDQGGKLIFHNTDTKSHSFASGTADNASIEKFNLGLIKAGESAEWTVNLEPGEYPYFCMVHPWTEGLLIVQEAGAAEEVHEEEHMEETVEEETHEEETVMEETVEEETVMEETVEEETVEEEVMEETSEGGGCLIATAAYGTELAPQVQFLREVRDGTVMSTASGAAFMTGFNTLYYSFSPTIADWERENPVFQEAVRAFITPMISTLSIMTLAEDGSEVEVLGLGISVIALNLAMYIAAPAVVAWQVKRRI